MSLLTQIQNEAIDGKDVESLLRRCRILASRLRHEDFKKWVQSELDGYRGDGFPLPDYRKFHGSCYGHFIGAFNRELRNAPIAESQIPPDVREVLTFIDIRQGIGSVQADIRDDADLNYYWPADALRLFHHNSIYNGFTLAQAWMPIPVSVYVDIVSNVRNRILSFVLEIEATNPDAGETVQGSTPIPVDQVNQIYNNYIYGNVGNVASGKSFSQNATVNVQQGDFKALQSFLEQHGLQTRDVQELKSIVDAERPSVKNKFGKNVAGWMGKMIAKAAAGTWDVATNVAADLLTKALNRYYGLGE